MKRGKADKTSKVRAIFFAAFASALLYVIVFPICAGKELFLLPAWTTDMELAEETQVREIPQNPKGGEEIFPFRLSGHLGYIDSRGKLLFHERVAYDAAMGNEFFVNYPAAPLNLLVRGRQGEFLGNIAASGYPFIRRGKLFIISPDGYGLSRVDERGELMWEKKFASLITAADAGDNSAVLGFLNGGAAVLSANGSVEYEAPSGGPGEAPVTLQVGVADDALYFVVLSGNPQRLELFVKQEDAYMSGFTAQLQSSYRRAVVARYFSEPDYFIFEQPEGAGVFQVEKKNLYHVRLPGQLLALASERSDGLFLALSAQDNRMYCTAFLPNGNRVFGFSWQSFPGAQDVPYFLDAAGKNFLLGRGGSLYRVDMGVY
ncbi:MAG: hypothetical protein LBT68_02900 [Spirochaetales bacterium]|jgi:hypothetical protein|nr:hypothetical protein [Spirochaetales bacterium]